MPAAVRLRMARRGRDGMRSVRATPRFLRPDADRRLVGANCPQTDFVRPQTSPRRLRADLIRTQDLSACAQPGRIAIDMNPFANG